MAVVEAGPVPLAAGIDGSAIRTQTQVARVEPTTAGVIVEGGSGNPRRRHSNASEWLFALEQRDNGESLGIGRGQILQRVHRAIGATRDEVGFEFGGEQPLLTDRVERAIENAITDGRVLHQFTRYPAFGQRGSYLARLTQRQFRGTGPDADDKISHATTYCGTRRFS